MAVYLRRHSTLPIEEVLYGRLPKAGEIAKRIQGQFKALREHLNQNASHFGLTRGRELPSSSRDMSRLYMPALSTQHSDSASSTQSLCFRYR